MLTLARRLAIRPCLYRVNAALWSSSATSPLERFNDAVANLDKVPEEPSNDVKLKLYALYKQATVGKCNTPKPGVFDLVNKAKWDAWSTLGDMPKEKAQAEYASIVDKLGGGAQNPSTSSSSASGSVQSPSAATGGDLTSCVEDKGFVVRFNRPTKKNSITLEMYETMIGYLKEAAERDDIHYLVLTGTGDFFSSGNDLGNFMNRLKTGLPPDVLAKEAAELVRRYVAAFINFPKPAVALVNGPSIGVSCTVLGLFDFIYASDKAFFHTPFTLLGLNPEGCSSYTFPRAMGVARANRVLMLNQQLSAQEAKSCGFITDVFPHATFHEETKKRLQELAKLPPKSLQYSKALVRDPIWADLHKANDKECDRLTERFVSQEAMQAVMNFFKDKGKL
ncbi:dodecenoyl-CoA delta-isomerase isoform X1 [Dermacentor variabilis]|uniref:dodecenoyl-CoA delta-isomerase isoform X1 n=2 Tax=Dermacentor variabilis TaxID=34621 RepID=UPI003F5BD756